MSHFLIYLLTYSPLLLRKRYTSTHTCIPTHIYTCVYIYTNICVWIDECTYVNVKFVNIFPFSSQELEQVFRGMMRSVGSDEYEGMNTHLLFAAHEAGSQRGPAVPLATLHIIFIDAMSQYLWWWW